MPGKIKVKILAGRNLPVMDRSGDTTDAYVEIKFGNTTYKTDVCRKSLNPQWNSEWYRFEVDDAELQDEPLQVRLMDHDTYSANDAIGKVYVNLNPLLLPGLPPTVKNIWTLEATMNSSIGSQGGSVMTGWIPVFDTMHGIRGEVNIIVKVELFSDCNKFRQSSCGVQFFYSPNIPHGYHAQVIHGFVEELVVSDDPEYKWIDKIRTPRASNEARQTLFFKLSGEVQRKIGLKALDLGGNAVIGYVQNFDLEGESGIVARGIGTAVTLVKLQDISSIPPVEPQNIEDLTSLGLQSKNPYDFSESDDSLPLLSHSPNLTPVSRSPTNIRSTMVSHRFPKPEKSPRIHKNVRVSEYRASSLRSRQLSLQSGANQPRKIGFSTLSLADDLISETSLKNLLALEDMRGEPTGNPFSRGFKNFRYMHQNILPRRVAQVKTKISDSLDDESDQESNYSSTWSLAGSESTRSSIVDLRQSIRRKKFTHKKNPSDGIAAMLIRSVHSGFPLDSVREDRETPTPSPVNFLDGEIREEGHSNDSSAISHQDENYGGDTIVIGKKKKRDLKSAGGIGIPMISSSETDTSTSDDDEPSESSTNYNILEDSYSLIDPSSPDERKFESGSRHVEKFKGNRAIEEKLVGIGGGDVLGFVSGGENLESSTDYNILEDNYSGLDANSMDEEEFDRNFRRESVKMAFSKSLGKKDSRIFVQNVIEVLSDSEARIKDGVEINLQRAMEVAKYSKSLLGTENKILGDAEGVKSREMFGTQKVIEEKPFKPEKGDFSTSLEDKDLISQGHRHVEAAKGFEDAEEDSKSLEIQVFRKIKLENEIDFSLTIQEDRGDESISEKSSESDTKEFSKYFERDEDLPLLSDCDDEFRKTLVIDLQETGEIERSDKADNNDFSKFLKEDEILPSLENREVQLEEKSNIEFRQGEEVGKFDKNDFSNSSKSIDDEMNLLSTSQVESSGKFQESMHTEKLCESHKSDFSKSLDLVENLEITNPEKIDFLSILQIESSDKLEMDLQRAMADAKLAEIHAKIEELLTFREDFIIEPATDEGRSAASQLTEDFKTSEVFQILDEPFPLFACHDENPNLQEKIESTKTSEFPSSRPMIVAVTLKNPSKNLEKSEEIKSESENSTSEVNTNFQAKSDCQILETVESKSLQNLESSYELKESELPPEKKLQIKEQESREGNPISIMLRDCHSTSSTNYNFLDESSSPIETNLLDDGKFNANSEGVVIISKPETQNRSDPILMLDREMIEDLDVRKDVKIEAGATGNPTFDSDEKFESSTDYNILDDNSSLIDSMDDGRIETSLREAIESMKSSEIQDSSRSTLQSSQKSERYLEKFDNISDDPQIEENTSLHTVLESIKLSENPSTIAKLENYLEKPEDILTGSQTEVNKTLHLAIESITSSENPSTSISSSSSIEKLENYLEKPEDILIGSQILDNTSTQQGFSCTESPKNLITPKSSPSSIKKHDEYLSKSEDIVIEGKSNLQQAIESMTSSKNLSDSISTPSLKEIDKYLEKTEGAKENLSPLLISPYLATPPISPNLEESKFDYSSRSPSPIPGSSPSSKLKHLKFLPKQKRFDSAEDVGFVTSTPVETSEFPDFVPNTPHESFESTKSDVEDERQPPKESLEASKSLIKEQILCPLGMTIDKVSIVNELKTPNPPKLKIKKLDPPQSLKATPEPKVAALKKEKPQKKIERTDTVIYKGPAKERYILSAPNRNFNKSKPSPSRPPIPIPIVVAPPPEEHATRLQVPVIQTTNINVQSTFSPDEMKTQHFGSIGARKFPIDECAMSERFGRKYRQHCMLDLLKTIDAKMMIHHLHHDRRDSTKSKKKKRERINASATPSPDSIHRTRTHKRRSRSRSPDRPHVHNKNQVSSLTTHSFPNPSSAIIKSSPSCDSSNENLSRNDGNPPIVVCPEESAGVSKESVDSTGNFDDDDHETSGADLSTNDVLPVIDNSKVESESCLDEVIDPTMHLLGPNDIDHPFFKSHSAGSLEKLRERFIVTTKMTNNPNTIDDLCVPCSPLILRQPDEQQPSSPVQTSSALPSSLGAKVTANSSAGGKTNTAIPNMHRRSSDSDLSITPKGNSLAGSDRSMGGHMRPSTAIVRTMNQDTMEMLEYPFITMQQYPAGFVINIGGLVSARSVKLLERITNLEEPEGRDAWWTEIRMEVRSHARALACNVVLGYKEEISICDDVCVLNASGTAAVINLLNASQDQETILLSRTIMTTSIESDREKNQSLPNKNSTGKPEESSANPGQQSEPHRNPVKLKRTSESNDHEIPYLPALMSSCSLCHLPYNEASVPFRVDVSKCAICRRAKVPDILFTTIELPENIPMTGRGVFLQATVCKCKRDLRGELNAKEISDCLPFLEYELHSLLLNKLKVKGMNAIFGLKVQVSVGERLVIGMAVGTAVYLTALPAPTVPKIASGNSWHNEEQLAEIQKTLIETVKKNREFYRLKPIVEMENGRSTTSDTDESDDDLPDLDLGIGTKDACVLEVDDVEDMDRINLLMDERPPDDFHVVNTQTIPGLEDLEIVRNLQMFTQISRAKIPAGQFASMPSKYFARMIQTVLFKLRRMVPCALCDMQFKVALPEQDEIQLSVVGMALGLGEPTRLSKYKRKLIPNSASKDPVKKTDENDMIFSLDEDQADNTSPHDSVINQSTTNISNSSPLTGMSATKHRPRSPFRTKSHMTHRHKHVPLKERYGVDITPLSYLPGGKIERYLGNLNFFFIRESTSIRENGGLSGFTHSFVTEILAIIRAHITALGGNAMVAFFMTQCVLLHSPHKNQGQSLINVGGDVVTVSYYGDDKYQGNQNC